MGLGDDWAKFWEASKEKAISKLSEADRQIKWKRKVTAPSTSKKRNENLQRAITAGLIDKGLAQVDPAEWASQTIAGLSAKTITETEKSKFEMNAKPFIDFVQSKSKELAEKGLTGKQALDWWYANVVEELKKMKVRKYSTAVTP